MPSVIERRGHGAVSSGVALEGGREKRVKPVDRLPFYVGAVCLELQLDPARILPNQIEGTVRVGDKEWLRQADQHVDPLSLDMDVVNPAELAGP